jgi:hypothetical protein
MIRFSPENKKPGNNMPVEKAKGQIGATPKEAMPETIMPVDMKPGTLQEIRSIATISIATDSFRCNRLQYCHKTSIRGNILHVLPQFSFVTVVTFFVAKEGVYCNKT